MNDSSTYQREILTPEGAQYVDMVMPALEKGTEHVKDKGLPAKINYYCRDCKKEVPTAKLPGKLAFKCKECDGERVSFGVEGSVQNYYKLINSKDKYKNES